MKNTFGAQPYQWPRPIPPHILDEARGNAQKLITTYRSPFDVEQFSEDDKAKMGNLLKDSYQKCIPEDAGLEEFRSKGISNSKDFSTFFLFYRPNTPWLNLNTGPLNREKVLHLSLVLGIKADSFLKACWHRPLSMANPFEVSLKQFQKNHTAPTGDNLREFKAFYNKVQGTLAANQANDFPQDLQAHKAEDRKLQSSIVSSVLAQLFDARDMSDEEFFSYIETYAPVFRFFSLHLEKIWDRERTSLEERLNTITSDYEAYMDKNTSLEDREILEGKIHLATSYTRNSPVNSFFYNTYGDYIGRKERSAYTSINQILEGRKHKASPTRELLILIRILRLLAQEVYPICDNINDILIESNLPQLNKRNWFDHCIMELLRCNPGGLPPYEAFRSLLKVYGEVYQENGHDNVAFLKCRLTARWTS